MKCGKYTLIGPETGKNADAPEAIAKRKRTGRIFWGVAVVALVAVLIWLNVVNPPKLAEAQAPAPTAEPVATEEPAPVEAVTEEPATVETVEDYTSDAPIGADVGNQLADFTTELLGGGEFHLADYRGKVVFINLWATYCPPCVEELPFFDQLAAEHPDDLVILAIHHRTGAKKAAGYLEDKGWDHLNFANDSKDKGLFDIVNGSEAMPQTIVLNRKGEVIYNVQSPVSYEQLVALYEKAGQQ